MNRFHRRTLGAAAILTMTALLQTASAGCGGTTTCDPGPCTGGSGAGGTGGSGGSADCAIDPPGKTFTVHVHNQGTMMLALTYGCGQALPIVLDTDKGPLPIGAGPVNACEVKCDQVYAGTPNMSCSDCGPGYGDMLAPGATVDILWDRRVYTPFEADPVCSGNTEGNDCALGTLVAKTGAQTGTLSACTDTTLGEPGYCSPEKSLLVTFTLDTTLDEGTIEIK